MSDHVLVEHDGAIATVVFNRPKMRNAISLAMWSEIATVTGRLAQDDSVRAIVYRGAGTDALERSHLHGAAPGRTGAWADAH